MATGTASGFTAASFVETLTRFETADNQARNHEGAEEPLSEELLSEKVHALHIPS